MNAVKSVFLTVVLCWTTMFVSGQIPKPMSPPRLVNDFANLIPPAMESDLEAKLLALEQSATVEVAVVTLTSNAGYDLEGVANALFNDEHWRIGKKELDNGLLFLISMDKADRGVRLETGYGMEGELPDAVCKRIINETILPHMHRANYAKGIEAGVNRIIKELGKSEVAVNGSKEAYGKAQKEEIARVREVKSEQDSSDNMQSLLLVLASMLGLGLLSYLVYVAYKRQKKLADRRKWMDDMRKTFDTACDVPEMDPEWPNWTQKKFEHYSNVHDIERRQADAMLAYLPKDKKTIIEIDDALFDKTEMQVGEVMKAKSLMLETIEDMKKYADSAANMHRHAENTLQRTEKLVSEMADRHSTSEYTDLLKAKAEELKKLVILTKEDHRGVYLTSQAIDKQCESIIEELWNEERLRLENNKKMSKLEFDYEQAQASLKTTKTDLETLQSSYSGKCLEGLLTYVVLAKLFEDGTSNRAKAYDLIRSSTRLKYNGADMLRNEAQKKLTRLKEGISAVESRKGDIGTKKRGYAEALRSAKSLYESAKKKVDHSDVGRTAKQMVENAKASINEVERLASLSRPDWIGAYEALEKANEYSQNAISKANSQISAAHAARVEAARPKYRPSSSIGGGSIRIGGGGGGFGGFGGGRSGGGGASGRF